MYYVKKLNMHKQNWMNMSSKTNKIFSHGDFDDPKMPKQQCI